MHEGRNLAFRPRLLSAPAHQCVLDRADGGRPVFRASDDDLPLLQLDLHPYMRNPGQPRYPETLTAGRYATGRDTLRVCGPGYWFMPFGARHVPGACPNSRLALPVRGWFEQLEEPLYGSLSAKVGVCNG